MANDDYYSLGVFEFVEETGTFIKISLMRALGDQ